MKILVAGFERPDMEVLSARLRDAGHSVLGASGRSSARILARGVAPDAVLVPDGDAGEEASSWVEDLLPDVPVHRAARAGEMMQSVSPTPASPASPEPAPASTLMATPVVAPRPDAPAPPIEVAAPPDAVTSVAVPAVAGPSAARGQLEARLAHVRFSDYHAVLDVAPDASPFVVRQNYERLRGAFTPTGWAGPLRPADIPLLDEIARGVEDAYSVLGDADTRARYERALKASARGTNPSRGR